VSRDSPTHTFTFACSQKISVSFVRSVGTPVCLSVCPHLLARLPSDRISWHLIMETFTKIFPKNTQIWLQPVKDIGILTWRPKYYLFLPTTSNRPNSPLFECNGMGDYDSRGGINITRTCRSCPIRTLVLFLSYQIYSLIFPFLLGPCYYYFFGATAPSGPCPPHLRGF